VAGSFSLNNVKEERIRMNTKVAQFMLVLVAYLGLSVAFAGEASQDTLKAQARITQEEASKTVLAKVPNGKIEAVELEKEHGKLIWSFDISIPKSKNIKELQVDAKTGKIISTQVETPKDQAKEKVADEKEKKRKDIRKDQ
jgi:uncharacterized membrane protein YkoI